jgi:hypothetical protein
MPANKRTLFIIQVCLGVALILGGCQWWRANTNSRYIADRCKRRILRSTDLSELQRWAVDLLHRYPPDLTNYTGPFTLPRGLQDVWTHTPYVFMVESSPAHEAHVRVLWGSGPLGHWGLWLGSTNLVAVDFSERLQPGVYFWRDFER